MKRREQALLLLAKAAQDEALLDVVIDSATVADEVFGFHCQQAAEKMLKALLSNLGEPFPRTHDIAALIKHLRRIDVPLPEQFEELDMFTPFGAFYRYDDFDSGDSLDRRAARAILGDLRIWIEQRLNDHPRVD
jgi:hypothetical protein